MTMTTTRREVLDHVTNEAGLFVATYSPGDGVTRYRFFIEPGNSYFGPANGIYTALGIKDAEAFVTGYISRQHQSSTDQA